MRDKRVVFLSKTCMETQSKAILARMNTKGGCLANYEGGLAARENYKARQEN